MSQTPTRDQMDVDDNPPGDSSPMKFPSSSPDTIRAGPSPGGPAAVPAINAPGNPLFNPPSSAPGGSNNPLFNPPSSAPNVPRSSDPLFFSDSSTGLTPASGRRARQMRGDIHSSLPTSTPSAARRQNNEAGGMASDLGQSNDQNMLTNSQPEQDSNEPRIVFWGTSVSLEETMAAFRKFLKEFKVKYRRAYDAEHGKLANNNDQGDGETLLYQDYLRTMRLTSQTNLNLDMTNLAAFPATVKLERWLRNYPQEVVPMCDQVLKDSAIEIAAADASHGVHGPVAEEELSEMEARTFKIRPFGGSAARSRGDGKEERATSVNMRELNPGDIDKLVTIKGLVIRTTPVIPDMKVAFFRCLACSHTVSVDIDRGRIAEPERCPREVCNTKGSMSLIHNRCEFADRQVIRLQETPDAVPDGQTPHTVSLCVYDELVDVCKPGDRITATGIFRSVPIRVNPKQRVIKTLFKTYVDVLHVKRRNNKRLGVDRSTREDESKVLAGQIGVGGDDDDFDEERELELQRQLAESTGGDVTTSQDHGSGRGVEAEERLKELSKRHDIYDLLARSLAPSIWEMEDVKKGVLLQLFGGTNKTIESAGGSSGSGPRYRGDINVLLVGDPGTSKSQILQYVHKIAPRGVYTSGKGSSAVGLTAYVTRDPDSKQLVLESGALVLSDGGVCCIDEFDKMSDATRSVLHEVMEQQTVSIAKAGIITTLNARTSILAAANPVGSRYNLSWPITKNIDLPPTLISRFDLLYLVLDKVDEIADRRLARHLVGLYLEDRPENSLLGEVLPIETLTAYISYARNRISPTLTEHASEMLVSNYVSMRSAGYDARLAERRITATTRQLESTIRLAEAHARMRFSERVEAEDVSEASRLIREALKESSTDPTTGLIDVDLLLAGQSTRDRKMRGDLQKEITNILDKLDSQGRGVRYSEVLSSLNEQSTVNVEPTEFSNAVRSLEQENLVRVTGERDRRVIKRLAGDSSSS